MAALRRLNPEFKGGSPLDHSQSPSPCGSHERAMMVACLGSCAAGTTLDFTSAAMPSIELEPWYKLPHSSPENRWTEAVFLLGSAVGALLSGLLLRFAGTRKTLLVSAFGQLCACVGVIVCNSVIVLMASRITCGFWLGVKANSVLLYVTDVAPPTKRAFFGGLTEVAMGAGMLAACSLEGISWELQATVCAVWPVMVLAFQHNLVESPRWLMARGCRQEANIAAARLFGIDLPPELRPKKEGEPIHSHHCLKQIRLVWACLLVNALQNLSFTPLFMLRALQALGSLMGESAGSAAAVLLLAAYVSVGGFFAFQRSVVGSRWLLGVSAVLVAATMLALRPLEYFVFSQWTLEKRPRETNWRGILSIGLLVLSYSVGLCQVPPLLTGELVPVRLRYIGCSFTSAWRWLGIALLLYFDSEVVAAVRYRESSLAFALVYLFATAIALAMIPKTEGRALADIGKDG